MSCSANALKRFPKDNKQIEVTIRDASGARIDNFQSEVSEIIFQAKNRATGSVDIDLRETTGEISKSVQNDESGDPQDVVVIAPSVADMNVAPGDYDIFLQLTLITPPRIFYVDMERDNNPLTELIILEGGVVT